MNIKVKKFFLKMLLFLAVFLSLAGCGRQKTATDTAKSEDAKAQTEEDAAENVTVETAGDILADLIKDEVFQMCVWRDADIETGDTEEIILQKMEQCESLSLDESSAENILCSLESLSLLPNLKSLTITVDSWDSCEVEDFTPIAELSRLEQLYIKYDMEEEIDLSFLAGMGTVTELYLPNCRIKDIAFLGEMPQLEHLSLYETPVDDLAVLEKLPELTELSIAGNANAQNIEVIGKLSKLQDLGLQGCGITDIGFLSSLTELRSINLNDNSITDVTPLARLTKLERLGAGRNKITDISPLAALSDLYDLALDGNEISDISALKNLSYLNQAGLSDNRITDLSPLDGKRELMYAAVFGNPCADLRPVWEVPLLSLGNDSVTKEEAERAENWIESRHAGTTEYTCIDYAENDLNGDGRTDIAFVLDGIFEDKIEGLDSAYEDTRRLYILLQQEGGSFQESAVLHLPGENSGGMRGNSYLGFFMGEGYLILKSGGGSVTGSTETSIYLYQEGKLERVKTISAMDCNFSYGYDVSVWDQGNNPVLRYAVAMDGYRMVRVDIADSDHPSHKAFPELDLYDMSYRIHDEKTKTAITPADALDIFRDTLTVDVKKEHLPYASWQKDGYELLKGVELPDYYYIVPGTEEKTDKENSDGISEKAWQGDYIYYRSLSCADGKFYHEICYVTQDGRNFYLLNDNTGEIREE